MRGRKGKPFRVMFVCFGNVCRSPMAEFIFREYAERSGVADLFEVASAATTCEEGRAVHPGTAEVLRSHGIEPQKRTSVLLRPQDAERWDLFVGMDDYNIRAMLRILGEDAAAKICKLGDLLPAPRDIADPWYTGDFEATYRDVSEGVSALIAKLIGEEK